LSSVQWAGIVVKYYLWLLIVKHSKPEILSHFPSAKTN